MTEERLYDYSKGLNAPYWIQEIKTKKGTRLWYFATPMQLSFFIVFTFVFVAMLGCFSFRVQYIESKFVQHLVQY